MWNWFQYGVRWLVNWKSIKFCNQLLFVSATAHKRRFKIFNFNSISSVIFHTCISFGLTLWTIDQTLVYQIDEQLTKKKSVIFFLLRFESMGILVCQCKWKKKVVISWMFPPCFFFSIEVRKITWHPIIHWKIFHIHCTPK